MFKLAPYHTMSTAADHKLRASSSNGDEDRRVVDHDAPYVTDDDIVKHATVGRSAMAKPAGDRIITVQPLKRSEMQASYAQDMGLGDVTHGLYGSCLNILGKVIGMCGAVPCLPCPNPYRNVNQGAVGLVSRFGKFYKVLGQLGYRGETLTLVRLSTPVSPRLTSALST